MRPAFRVEGNIGRRRQYRPGKVTVTYGIAGLTRAFTDGGGVFRVNADL